MKVCLVFTSSDENDNKVSSAGPSAKTGANAAEVQGLGALIPTLTSLRPSP